MKLQLMKALNRQRLRRKVAQERARLEEMRENAKTLLDVQARTVGATERRYEASLEVSSAEVARRIDRNDKQWMFA